MTEHTEKQWKYALVQHPMWLIIAEDSVCAERTPPWGCASLDEYVGRLGRSLDALEQYPELRVAFDFSAMELEDAAERCPDLVQRLRALALRGSASFTNGTYSQPHLQMLSVESAIRQFEHGLRSIEALTGCRVRCYAAQEPGITPYLPQILRAMGYETASTPDFPFGIRLEGGCIQHWDKRWEWLAGDDIVNWAAPDGSAIPLWLETSGWPDDRTLADERQHGLLRHSRLRADMPDMVEVTGEWVEKRSRACEFVLLDEALAEAAYPDPNRATAYLDANYAYCEGVDAEALSRANARAESALLTLEAVRTMVGGPAPCNCDALWRKLLKAQHHDAYWTGAPELRAKAIGWLQEVNDEAVRHTEAALRNLASDLPQTPPGCAPILVVGAYPARHRGPVEIPVEWDGVELVDEHGNGLPVQIDEGRATFVAQCDGLGYHTCFLRPGPGKGITREPLGRAFRYSNAHYSLDIGPDATVTSAAAPNGTSLLGGAGNAWLYQADGEDVLASTYGAAITRGPVSDSVECEFVLGPARLRSTLAFYHELPWFEVRTELSFDSPAEIGDYFDDRTKLHFAWPLGEVGTIRHAVGGWPAEARIGRTFVASPWLDAGGLAICLFGAGKCWVDEDSVLRCVVAWGQNGDRFHNRQGPLPGIMGPLNWAKPMDLRLQGTHTIRYAVWPHGDDVTVAGIANWAASLMMPPVGCPVDAGGGGEPCSRTSVSLTEPGVAGLSVRRGKGGEAILRLMELAGESHRLADLVAGDWRFESARELDGTGADVLRPYKIAEVVFRDRPAVRS